MKSVFKKASHWLLPPYDEKTRLEVKELMARDERELAEAFSRELVFGTGGVREKMGVGTNRINEYTLAVISQGVVHYLKKKYLGKKYLGQGLKIAMSYDTRNNSRLFVNQIAQLLARNGISVFLFKEPKPTPLLSFAVRELQCHLGIVITASHNPKEYNGYKVYDEKGGQIVEPVDIEITDEIKKVNDYRKVKKILEAIPMKKEIIEKKIVILDEAIENAYFEMLFLKLKNKTIFQGKTLTYSALHGNGIYLLPGLFHHCGLKKVNLVASQCRPSGDFPTVALPNPEDPSTHRLGIKALKKNEDDLLFLTDPDSDRLGVVVREKEEMFIPNGNQIGVLLLNYLLEEKLLKEKSRLEDYYAVTTVVSTPLFKKLARRNKLPCFTTLTGFKYIGATMEKQKRKKFLFAMEESYGYLTTDEVRDKDAISAALLFSEMFFFYRSKNLWLSQVLARIYLSNDYFLEDLFTLTKEGQAGKRYIDRLMERLRKTPPKEVKGIKMVEVLDYQEKVRIKKGLKKKFASSYPISNLLQFSFADKTLISVRPSGTEPKVKFYISVQRKVTFDNLVETKKILQNRIADYKNFFVKE